MSLDERKSRLIRNSPRRRQLKLSADEQKRILDYLKNPTGSGIWRLDVKWKHKKGLSEFLKELVDSEETSKKRVDYRSTRFLEMADNPAYLLLMFSKISFFVRNTAKDHQIRTYFDSISEDIVEMHGREIYEKYSDIFDYFEKNILSADFFISNNSDLSSLKSGSFLVTAPRENYYSFVAFNEETLLCIYNFLIGIDKIGNSAPYTIYSPEEELLAPYVRILESYIHAIDMSSSIKSHFHKMIEDYYSENYTGCVSAAGLVAEECLTQVYETITRQAAPKNLMLGQISSQIGDNVQLLLKPQKQNKMISHSDLIKRIKKLSENESTSKAIISSEKLLADYIDSKINKLKEEIQDSKGNISDYAVYPKIIRTSLEDVILYRNAASHKSTYPIDSLKALKGVYGSLALVLWWNSQRLRVSAAKTKKEVVQDFVTFAGSYE